MQVSGLIVKKVTIYLKLIEDIHSTSHNHMSYNIQDTAYKLK